MVQSDITKMHETINYCEYCDVIFIKDQGEHKQGEQPLASTDLWIYGTGITKYKSLMDFLYPQWKSCHQQEKTLQHHLIRYESLIDLHQQ